MIVLRIVMVGGIVGQRGALPRVHHSPKVYVFSGKKYPDMSRDMSNCCAHTGMIGRRHSRRPGIGARNILITEE